MGVRDRTNPVCGIRLKTANQQSFDRPRRSGQSTWQNWTPIILTRDSAPELGLRPVQVALDERDRLEVVRQHRSTRYLILQVVEPTI